MNTGSGQEETTSGPPSARMLFRAARADGNAYTLERAFPFDPIYSLLGAGRRDRALDLVFGEFTSAFEREDWAWCERVIEALELDRLDTHLAIGFLTATFPAREHLPARAVLLGRVRGWLPSKGKSPAQVENLLRGLV